MNPTQAAALRDSMGIARRRGMGAAGRHRRQCPAGRRGAARAQRASPAKSAQRSFGHDRDPRNSRAAGRGAIDPGRLRPDPARPQPSRRRPRRPHRHHLARRHRLDQPRRLGQPARPVQAARNGGRLRRRKDCLGAKMVGDKQGPAYRAGHRRIQPVPDARRARPVGRFVRAAAVPDRHALRPVHRPRPR